jgi:hypothetical protein
LQKPYSIQQNRKKENDKIIKYPLQKEHKSIDENYSRRQQNEMTA